MKLITDYSLWFFPLCVIVGLGYAFLLYYKNTSHPFSKKLQRLLFVLRFVLVTLLAFLLLSPLIKINKNISEKPVIIFLQDNTFSLLLNKDSSFIRNDYLRNVKDFHDKMKSKYDVKNYSFGSDIKQDNKIDFSERQTDIAQALQYLSDMYLNRNIGAVVLASDGLYNKGSNPLFVARKSNFAINTIAMGDTNIYRDVILASVRHNKVSFLGNSFPVEINIKALQCKGYKTQLTVYENGMIINSQTLDIPNDNFFKTVQLMFQSNKSGINHYKVVIDKIDDESNILNNTIDFFIEVIESKDKILILYSSPHPDVSALKQSFETNETYQVETYSVSNFPKKISDYNLVVFHSIPSIKLSGNKYIEDAEKLNIPMLFILGVQTDFNAFSNLKKGIIIKTANQSPDEAFPLFNNNFSLFTVSDELKSSIKNLPPLTVPYADYQLSQAVEVLFYQRIGSVSTQKPLIVLNNNYTSRSISILGEGIWKWRLYNYIFANNHNAFDELAGKFIQYLSVKENKGLFRVKAKNVYKENDVVEFDAELYNDSYELINDDEVQMIITNEEAKKFNFNFSKILKTYHLDAGFLPSGTYSFEAKVIRGGKPLLQNGQFIVSSVNEEEIQTIANHKILNQIAKETNGKMYFAKDFSKISDDIINNQDIKPVRYTLKKYTDLLDSFWMFLIIILLLSVEWFLRKFAGCY